MKASLRAGHEKKKKKKLRAGQKKEKKKLRAGQEKKKRIKT